MAKEVNIFDEIAKLMRATAQILSLVGNMGAREKKIKRNKIGEIEAKENIKVFKPIKRDEIVFATVILFVLLIFMLVIFIDCWRRNLNFCYTILAFIIFLVFLLTLFLFAIFEKR